MLWKILKPIFFILGIVLMLNGFFLMFTANMNLGIILVLLLGSLLVFIGVVPKIVFAIIPKWLKAIVAVLLAAVIGISIFLFGYGTTDNVTYNEDAIVVLGAGVKGDVPGPVLQARLDAAAKYHGKNPHALIIVSGGKGPQESITEAEAMEKYLLSKGVDEAVIIKEDKATSTYENFINSKEILDKRFGENYSIAYVTSEYHVYRAGQMAKNTGYGNPTHLHSDTAWYGVASAGLRESLAAIKFWIFKN